MDVSITTENGKIALRTPYNADVVAASREIGGKWDAPTKAWRFDVRDEQRVRDLAVKFFGTDGSAVEAADLVTVRVRLADHEGSSYVNYATFCGRRIAERPGRDQAVRLAAGVVLVEGTLPASGGSMRYPTISADQDVVVEVRDLPRTALKTEPADSYEIVDEQVDTDALLAERDRLLARLAEIDAALPEPEGVEVSTRQAAAALGVSIRTVQRWAATGKVAATRNTAGHWVITITTRTDRHEPTRKKDIMVSYLASVGVSNARWLTTSDTLRPLIAGGVTDLGYGLVRISDHAHQALSAHHGNGCIIDGRIILREDSFPLTPATASTVLDDSTLGLSAATQDRAVELRDELLAAGVPAELLAPVHADSWSGGLQVLGFPVLKTADGYLTTHPHGPNWSDLCYPTLASLLTDLTRRY